MTLLILGGSGEGRALSKALSGRDAILSLAGATRMPLAQGVPVVSGGFGGENGFRAFVGERGITAVLDATHPFAHRITARSARVCAELGIPYLQLSRPPWVPEAGDNWIDIDQEEEAAALIPDRATVFLGTGRGTLERFANLQGRQVICRQIDPPTGPFPFEGGSFLIGRPPFSIEDEERLFRDLGVDVLIVKNAGGEPSRTKLVAARHLGIPVIMIRRPPQGNWDCVHTVEEALAWVSRQ